MPNVCQLWLLFMDEVRQKLVTVGRSRNLRNCPLHFFGFTKWLRLQEVGLFRLAHTARAVGRGAKAQRRVPQGEHQEQTAIGPSRLDELFVKNQGLAFSTSC